MTTQICEHKDCTESAVEMDYCEEHYEWHYCECGHALGEYAGEGFCKRCM